MPRDETDLERAVFGGSDSELSSDEGEDLNQEQLPPPQKPGDRGPKSADRFESSGADSEDDYVQRDGAGPKKKRLSKKSRGEEGERRVAPKKRKRKQLDEEELKDLPPEQANKLRREAKLDDMIRGQRRGYRPRKKKGDDLDAMADEEIARLREAMNNAADEDMRANSEKLPATAKLKLLPEAMETLRKASLAQSMIDNNLLEAVKRWLEPLPDGSLPALNIQRELFYTIKKMEFIDSAVLKESGLGRVVLFYTKCKRVTLDISRIANDLVSVWSRPIIKRSASYRDRVIPQAQSTDDTDMRAGERLSAILARAKEEDKNRVRKNAVMIPTRSLGTYTVAPKDNTGRANPAVAQDTERRRKHGELLRSLTRRTGGS